MNDTSVNNIKILATAADLVCCLVNSVAGEDVAPTIAGQPLTSEMINESTLVIFHRDILSSQAK